MITVIIINNNYCIRISVMYVIVINDILSHSGGRSSMLYLSGDLMDSSTLLLIEPPVMKHYNYIFI